MEEGSMKENRILQIWRILYPPLLYLLISYIVQLVGILFFLGREDGSWLNMNQEELQLYINDIFNQKAMLLTFISAIISLPLCYLPYYGDLKRQRRQSDLTVLKRNQVSLKQWAFIVLLGMAASISLNDWIALSGIITIFDGFEEVAEALYGGNLIMEFLSIVIAAPFIEELIFRGLVYQRIRRMAGVRIAIVLSALYFGIYHMNVVQGIYAFLLGLLLAWVCEKYHTLWASVLFHMSANLLSLILTEWSFGYRITVTGVIIEIILSTVLMVYAILKIHRTVK